MSAGVLFQPGRIGPVEIANRVVRAGTSETSAGEAGEITDKLVEIYEDLARNRVGLILSGHMYCHTRGQYARRQVGIHEDGMVPGLTRLAEAVHRHGGKLFAQLAHAGSQSRVAGNQPLAPSPQSPTRSPVAWWGPRARQRFRRPSPRLRRVLRAPSRQASMACTYMAPMDT